MKDLIIICGPTAVGKTKVAIEIANYFNTEIINADSRQFFKEMTIGTAKPTKEELSQAKHHFVNCLSIDQDYSAGDFEREALLKCEELFKSFDQIVVAGGSGLYIKALCDGFDKMPEIYSSVRENLNKTFEEKGIEYLQKLLKEKDPEYADEVDLQNPQRVIRALEIILSSGKKYSELRTSQNSKSRNFNCIYIGLERPRTELYERINLRVDQMMKQGLLNEVKTLYAQKHYNALNTVGYKEFFAFLDNEYSLERAVELLKRNSRRYAKRQMTWFNKINNIKWFHPENLDEIKNYLCDQLTN